MKINQLFTRCVELDVAHRLAVCIGLDSVDDGRNFTKYDLIRVNAVQRFKEDLLNDLVTYYLPCKAKLYLVDINEKKLITVVKQVLRLHSYCVMAKEKNFGSKKVIVYRVISTNNFNHVGMHHAHTSCHVDFN
jgi:hypothetical protein